ncbi:MAG: hypothetical protein MZW92_19605 [Comamonadaceae bacterium]|nr:hypothetical protein [Comamonadaceae bacterium]
MLALHAFGLEESNLLPAGRGRRPRARWQADPRVPWAVHAVAHVMEMQGRFEDGAAWLRQHQPAWAEGNGFAGHLWWHKALFRLEALDFAGVLRLVDAHLSGDALADRRCSAWTPRRMLWRLHLLGEDVAARCAERSRAAGTSADADAGHYAFNDVHAVIAMLGAGDVARAEPGWRAAPSARCSAARRAARSNHAMAREVGLPLMRGLLALRAAATSTAPPTCIYPVRAPARALRRQPRAARPDRPDAAGRRGARRPRATSAARCSTSGLMAKPVTPLTRHWIEAAGACRKRGAGMSDDKVRAAPRPRSASSA